MSEPKPKRSIGRHACENCRKAKVKCLTESLERHGKCRKCFDGGLDCEWKEISKTRVRKRTDARVAELERQLSSLTAAMGDIRRQTSSERVSGDGVELHAHFALTPSLEDGNTTVTHTEDVLPTADCESISTYDVHAQASDPISSNSFSIERKEQLLVEFVTTLLPQYPVVAVAENTSFRQLEEEKPFAAHAIVTAACCVCEPKNFRNLHNDNIAMLIKAIVIEGRKSMDLLQALLITATWACPPDDLSNLNIYQWSHIACTMALELGLGGKTSLQAQAQSLEDFMMNPSDTTMDTYRTMFGVYLSCSRLAVSFRRQRMISFSASTDSIIELFTRHARNVEDRRLVAWLRLQSIAEDIESMKQNAEMRRDPTFMEESSFKNDFALFQDRLRLWENALDPVLWVESLKIDFGLCKCKLHEIAIYCGNNIQQLDLPALAVRAQKLTRDHTSTMSPRYIRALLSFIEGCHFILEVFLRASLDTIRVLPILTTFRAPFAFKALAMLRKRMRNPQDEICKVIDDQTLAWDFYSGGVSEVFEAASANRLYVYPSMALRIRDFMVRSYRAGTEKQNDQDHPTNSATKDQPSALEPEVFNSMDQDLGLCMNETNFGFADHLPIGIFPLSDGGEIWHPNFIDFQPYQL